MRRSRSRALAAGLVALAFAISACQTVKDNPKATIGGATGAAAGGLIGAAAGGETAGILGGVLLGGLLGGAVGNALDQRDRDLALKERQYALENEPTGQSSAWVNPDSGHRGSVTPTRTYRNESGQPCREFTETVVIGGEEQQAYGTACRQPDGTWRVVQ